MAPDIRIRTWVRASEDDVRAGLLGYMSIEYGDVILDSITLRRTAEGRLALSFPARTDRAGRRHPYCRPADDTARRHIERAILGQLADREAVS